MEEKEKQQQEQQMQKQQENQDMVQWNDVKGNSGKATTAIIILLLVIIIAGGVFIFMKKDVLFNSKTDNKEVEKNTTKEVEKEVEEFTLDDAKELLDKFGLTLDSKLKSSRWLEVYEGTDVTYNDDFKLANAAANVDEGLMKTKTCDELYEGKAKVEYNRYVLDSGNVCKKGDNSKIIDYNDLNKVYKELYGSDAPKKRISLVGMYYKFYEYNSEENYYNQVQCGGCGGTNGPTTIEFKVRSANVDGNKLEITVAYNRVSGEEREPNLEDSHLDEVPNYIITFKKDDDHYIFESLNKK